MHNRLGQGDKALKFANMAYAAQPDNIQSIRNYAHAKIINGETFEGISLLKNIVDVDTRKNLKNFMITQ